MAILNSVLNPRMINRWEKFTNIYLKITESYQKRNSPFTIMMKGSSLFRSLHFRIAQVSHDTCRIRNLETFHHFTKLTKSDVNLNKFQDNLSCSCWFVNCSFNFSFQVQSTNFMFSLDTKQSYHKRYFFLFHVSELRKNPFYLRFSKLSLSSTLGDS